MAKTPICLIRIASKTDFSAMLVSKAEFTVGRLSENEVCLTSPDVSRTHLSIHVVDNEVWVKDLGSSNGSYLNDNPLTPKSAVLCRTTDRVRLGKSDLTLSFERIETEPAAVKQILDEVEQKLVMARQDAGRIEEEAKRKAREIVDGARESAQMIRSKNESDASEFLKQTRDQAAVIVASAHAEMAEIQKKAEAEIDLQLSEKRKSLAHVKIEAQTEAEEILKQARLEKLTIQEKAENEALDSIRHTKLQQERLLQEAEDEAEQVLQEARKAAQAIREDAMAEAEAIQGRAKAQAELDVAAKQKQADEQIKKTQTSIRQDIRKLEEQKGSLEKEVLDLEDLRDQQNVLRQQILESEQKLKDLQNQIHSKEETLQVTSEKVREASAKTRAAEELKAAAQREAKTIRDEAQVYARNLRDKAQADYDERRDSLEEDLAHLKVEELKKMEERRKESEKQIKMLRQHQARELSRHLEMWLAPRLAVSSTESEGAQSDPILADEIQKIVDQVMLAQTESEGDTLKEVITFDPEAEKASRTQKWKWVARAAAACAVVAVTLVLPHWPEQLGTLMFGGAVSGLEDLLNRQQKELAEKALYKPVQTDEFKDTYTDNVLFTTDYVDWKLDSHHQEKYIVLLNGLFVEQLKLSENTIVKFIALEFTLVEKLKAIKAGIHPDFEQEGIVKMREAEAEASREMTSLLDGDERLSKAHSLEKQFYLETHAQKSPASLDGG